ncbi:extracellular solute-binding protein [Natrinema ejinorense]|uniref:ABC transporter substrate-binding protein n=1 Tax=Natrinema ejinorense TaxID=373386 RepID=A0A2A5QPR0_9EURY|nr:extracellular solute-binding protein [Natrinema ejinorense]PCR88828.1 ABC transporter substrate-binding protein [Natrinema ejinorense]
MAHNDKPYGTVEGRPDGTTGSATRRRFLAGAGSAATATALAGCLGGSGDGNENEISVAFVSGEGELFESLVDEYIEDDTGITVNVELFPYANLFERTQSVLSTQGNEYDILCVDDPWFPQFAPDLDPIEQWLPEGTPDDQLLDTVKDIATWPTPGAPDIPSAEGLEQQRRGQVIVGNAQLFAYNEAHFEEVGADAPETWGDVYEAGQQISDQIDGTDGFIIRGKRGNPVMANFFALGNAIGGQMFDDDWGYNWAGEDGTSAVDFYINDLKSISPDGVTTFDSDAVLNSLSDGSVAQGPAWPAAASNLLGEDSAEADNLAFTPIPKGHIGAQQSAPTQGNWIMGINSYISDAKKESAGEVIQSAISKEAQDSYVELGGVPFRHDTFEDNMDAQPWFSALYESLQTAQWRPRTPLWSEIQVEHGTLLNSALAGDISAEECTQQAQETLEEILDGSGYYG